LPIIITKQYSILSNETGSFIAMQCKQKILHLILAINSNLHLLNPAYLINAASMFYILAVISWELIVKISDIILTP
jgi:hypothetical protein